MLAKRIIPCLDVKEGRVVKGTNFVNLRDAGDPVELAALYNQQGADELVFLDITASSDKRYILRDLVEKTAAEVDIPFTVGGGISDMATIKDLLMAGADKVSINSAAFKSPELIKQASDVFGNQAIVIAIDAKESHGSPQLHCDYPVPTTVHCTPDTLWEVYSHGGRHKTGIDALKWSRYMAQQGAGELLVTSMDHDGTKSGYAMKQLTAIHEHVNIPVIASGGAGTCQHIIEALATCEAALLASLLHYQELSITEIKNACRQAHIPIR